VYAQVADLKNSVKERGNAQSSFAGTFIGEHLHPEYQGGWLHCDMAGPADAKERGTGYGVALVLALLEVDGFSA
jgi:probable aminopeptidase NPEPL1